MRRRFAIVVYHILRFSATVVVGGLNLIGRAIVFGGILSSYRILIINLRSRSHFAVVVYHILNFGAIVVVDSLSLIGSAVVRSDGLRLI